MLATNSIAPRAFRLAVILALFVPAAARSEEGELQPTTEFGITITPDNLYDAIQETQDFWPPVRAYVAGPHFTVADPSVRREASAFIARVNDHLHDRLFGEDEATALDLMDYLAARLRVYELYRQLRSVLADDALLVTLKNQWEADIRELNVLAEDERIARYDEVIASMRDAMTARGIDGAKLQQATDGWKIMALAIHRMNTTGAGRQMLFFEQQVKSSDRAQAELIRSVVATSDWAQITKSKTTSLNRDDFIAAWEQRTEYEAKAADAVRR